MMDPFGNTYEGTYTTRIAISATNASNSPQYIDVTFTILPPTSLTAYASYDNSVMSSSMDSNVENTVYSNSEISVGVDYYQVGDFHDYVYTASAIKFNIQSQIAGRSIASATLRLYVYSLRGDFNITPKIRVNAFYDDWDPNTFTYSSWLTTQFYDEVQVELNAPNNSVLPLDFDVTTMVKNWASGAWNNCGFQITPQNYNYPGSVSFQATSFQSLEIWKSFNKRPQLIIQFE